MLAARAAGQDDAPPDRHHVTPPPNPEDRQPELLANVHLGSIFQFSAADICPGGASCVLGNGAALGVSLEWRWPTGLGTFLGYEVWFVDSGGVFELGTAQIVRAGLVYAFQTGARLRPIARIAAGALVFGDTGLISTVGGAVDAGLAGELELTSSASLTLGADLRLFTTTPFVSARDDTLRTESLNIALYTYIGIAIVTVRGVRE